MTSHKTENEPNKRVQSDLRPLSRFVRTAQKAPVASGS